MIQQSRRRFLVDVGNGMVAASVGSSLAADLGFDSLQYFADNQIAEGRTAASNDLLQEVGLL